MSTEATSSLGVCFVSSEYPSDHHRGGIGTYTEKTARAVAALGHDVSVVTEALDNTPSTAIENGVRVVRIPAPTSGRLRLVTWSRAVAASVRRLPRRPDVIQVCEHRAEGVWLAARRMPSTKLVTRLATPTFLVQQLNRDISYSRAQTRYMDALERFQTRRSDAVISPTRALAEVVCHRWSIDVSRVRIMRTGVDFASRFERGAGELPSELRGRRYLLYFGRLEERKGVHVLAEALPRVLEAHPDLHVVFAGNNLLTFHGKPMQAHIEDRLRSYIDRVHFYERLPQPALHPVLANALAVVLPSLWEALGNVTLEAIDMGRPTIATTGSGFGEVIESGRSGLLVRPGDVGELRDALLRLVGDDDLRATLSQGALARARDFELGVTAHDLVNMYRGLLGHSSPPSHRLELAGRDSVRGA